MNIFQWNILLISIYAFIFLILFKGVRQSKKIFVILASIQLILISGLRAPSVGIDMVRYYRVFSKVLNSSIFSELFNTSRQEVGYLLFQKIFTLFSSNFQIYIFLISTFVFVTLGMFIYKYSSAPYLSFMLYICLGFYDFSFSGMRQTIAMTIIMISFRYIIENKPIKFLFTVVIAAMFHVTALVFLPIYIIAHKKWTKIDFFCSILIFIVIFIFRNSLGSIIMRLFKEEYIGRYISSGQIGEVAILIFLIIVLGSFINNPVKYRSIYNTVLFGIMCVAFAIQMLSSYAYAYTRLNFYFTQFIIIYLPYVFSNVSNCIIKFNNKQTKIIRNIAKSMTLVLLILYYLQTLQAPSFGSLPYYFFWE